MAVTAKQVKELRELTGAGMMDCKKALTETDGDIEKAVDWLRQNGLAKAAKKEGRIAAEGLSRILINGNKAAIVEVNSETDFVAKNDQFLALLDETLETIIASDAKTVEEALALTCKEGTLADAFTNAVATIGEKITLRRFEVIEKADDGGYYVTVCITDGTRDLMSLTLLVPERNDAETVKKNFYKNPEKVYSMIIAATIQDKDMINELIKEHQND